MVVFFFLVSPPSDEETQCGQPAPCGQTTPWSHPYSSQCSQPAPLVLTGYMAVFFFLVSHPSDEQTLCRQPAPCGQTEPWSHPYLTVTHGSVLLSCESPYSSLCGQPAPLVLTGYMAVFFFLVSPPCDEETPCGQQHPVAKQHPGLIPTHPNVASQHPWC